MSSSETTPLLAGEGVATATDRPEKSTRETVFAFLEAQTPAGAIYEWFTIFLILINVLAFILATLFVEQYNPGYNRGEGFCGDWCDTIFFGNYSDNGLGFLGIGATSVLELLTVAVFSVDYLLRVWTADLESVEFAGFVGRLKYLPTFYSLVDLASTVPFYIDAFALPNTDLVASQFLRMFRLFRMMRVEGRYDTALTMFDDVFYEQKGILGTALFVGVTTWMTVSSLYYYVERRSNDMIYCGAAPDYCGDPDDIDVSLCEIDFWGITDCSAAGCPATEAYPEPCYNLYKSIPMASYFALLNLFGEFPLIDQHNTAGKVVGTLVAIVAVAVFALPAGIIGNGFEDLIERRREAERAAEGDEIVREPRRREAMTVGFVADESTVAGSLYNFMFGHKTAASKRFELFINLLIVGTAITFMLETIPGIATGPVNFAFDIFELFAVVVFTIEYVLRVYASAQDPKYAGLGGRVKYMWSFLAVVDLLTVVPYWLEVVMTGEVITTSGDSGDTFSTAVKALRLFRLLRFEKYTHAFTSFDDVISDNVDVLAVTGYTAGLLWVFFSAILYFTERDNPDAEVQSFYRNVPNAMWITLLNLTGESPLAHYSLWGKITTGLIGLFATGLFGIPIGVLGAGFEEVVEEETEDAEDELNGNGEEHQSPEATVEAATPFEKSCYLFVNGEGSKAAQIFEIVIYFMILVSVTVGIIQTVAGHEDSFMSVEFFTVALFTFEYLIRFIGVPADPQFGGRISNGFLSRLRFIVSFYSMIDLLAILPFYLALMFPESVINEYDEFLRMFRLLRLIKLDKYIPSITLIDDVLRLKKAALTVAGFAAGTLWIIFAAFMFLTETNDTVNEIDNVPLYGCSENCTMSNRFQNYFDSWYYTGIHLTGDYPIITYTWPARFINFFMVIAAVGVVSIPSGLIASGFVDIVQSKQKVKKGENVRAGDDWYDIRRRELENVDPPPSPFGPWVDELQIEVNQFLNGTEGRNGKTTFTPFARFGRIFIFTIIVLNVLAVIVESIPEVDRAVGNQPGNFFDAFEFISVIVFLTEYVLRLFCAPKNKEALYSTIIYATTFFGIVDALSTFPYFIEKALIAANVIDADSDSAMMFRIFRIFRMLQLEDFVTAFSLLDNVFRASLDVFRATGLLALIIWVGCAALFYLFEENNPNWRSCDMSIPTQSDDPDFPGCYDFSSTAECNSFYPGLCEQRAFNNVPNALYYTAVFLGGEWGVTDFTWPGRFVCLFLCVAGIALYAIPIGTLFDSFGAVLGMGGDDDEEEDEEEGSGEA